MEWVECNLIVIDPIHTCINYAGQLRKLVKQTLFYQHINYSMGHIPLLYSPCYSQTMGDTPLPSTEHVLIEDLIISTYTTTAAHSNTAHYTWIHNNANLILFQTNPLSAHWLAGKRGLLVSRCSNSDRWLLSPPSDDHTLKLVSYCFKPILHLQWHVEGGIGSK